jgi:hypothetical protein
MEQSKDDVFVYCQYGLDHTDNINDMDDMDSISDDDRCVDDIGDIECDEDINNKDKIQKFIYFMKYASMNNLYIDASYMSMDRPLKSLGTVSGVYYDHPLTSYVEGLPVYSLTASGYKSLIITLGINYYHYLDYFITYNAIYQSIKTNNFVKFCDIINKIDPRHHNYKAYKITTESTNDSKYINYVIFKISERIWLEKGVLRSCLGEHSPYNEICRIMNY